MEVKVFSVVQFRDDTPIFRDFVQDFYQLRLAAKRAKDTVKDIQFKGILNSTQGKYGQQ